MPALGDPVEERGVGLVAVVEQQPERRAQRDHLAHRVGMRRAASRPRIPPALQPITLTRRPVRSASSRTRCGPPSRIAAVGPRFWPELPAAGSSTRARAAPRAAGWCTRRWRRTVGARATGWPSPRGCVSSIGHDAKNSANSGHARISSAKQGQRRCAGDLAARSTLDTAASVSSPRPNLRDSMLTLLHVHHTTSPSVHAMFEAVQAGAIRSADRRRRRGHGGRAAGRGVRRVGADGYLLGTPANLGYMSGALKHFFDQIYYPCLDATVGRPFGVYVHGNNDTTGALACDRDGDHRAAVARGAGAGLGDRRAVARRSRRVPGARRRDGRRARARLRVSAGQTVSAGCRRGRPRIPPSPGPIRGAGSARRSFPCGASRCRASWARRGRGARSRSCTNRRARTRSASC